MIHGWEIPWSAAAHGVSLGLCALILYRLHRMRRAARGRGETLWAEAPVEGFAEAMRRESAVQQAEQCLEAIAGAVARERERLHRRHGGGGFPPERAAAAPPSADAPDRHAPTPAAPADGRYAAARRMALEGLGAREISARLGLPFGEVVLAVKTAAVDSERRA